MRRILSARLSVTLIGKPSGTATTTNVTATIKACKISVAVSRFIHELLFSGSTPKIYPIDEMATVTNAPVKSHLNHPPSFTDLGSLESLPSNSRPPYIIGNHTFIMPTATPNIAPTSKASCLFCIGTIGSKTTSLRTRTKNVKRANIRPTTPINLAKESN